MERFAWFEREWESRLQRASVEMPVVLPMVMGGAGAAPPVRGDDVMILVGSSILLMTFILHAWVNPIMIDADTSEVVMHDLSEGDEFTIDVTKGSILITTTLPSDEVILPLGTEDSTWTFTASESGIHEFNIEANDDAEFSSSVSRGFLMDYGLYVAGVLILAFGVWKRYAASKAEPVEALLED